jgi:agmatinase
LQRISNSIHLVNAAGKIPFVIGGDHLITLGVLMGMQMADQEFQVIHLDAHSDTELEARKSSRLNNGNFVNRAAALPRIKSWVHVGGRGYTGLVPKLPNNYFSCEPSNIERHLTSGMPVYLTIDSDFFDPSIFPAVNFPVPDGYNSEVFLNILGAIAASGSRIIGVDWVEYNPDRDDDLKQSGRFVVQHVIEVLSLIAVVDSRLARCTPMIARDVRSLVQNQAADGS